MLSPIFHSGRACQLDGITFLFQFMQFHDVSFTLIRLGQDAFTRHTLINGFLVARHCCAPPAMLSWSEQPSQPPDRQDMSQDRHPADGKAGYLMRITTRPHPDTNSRRHGRHGKQKMTG